MLMVTSAFEIGVVQRPLDNRQPYATRAWSGLG
jgi:hypothetical protein